MGAYAGCTARHAWSARGAAPQCVPYPARDAAPRNRASPHGPCAAIICVAIPSDMRCRAPTGYRATPTYIMCIVYCLYWIIVTSIMMWRYKKVPPHSSVCRFLSVSDPFAPSASPSAVHSHGEVCSAT
jgi:hypothetical protein